MHDAGIIGLTLLPMLYYIGLALPIVLYILSRRRLRADQPPSATGWRPLIGHALSYKGDPAAFLTKQCCTVGPCFSIDLAGKKMVVVGHCREAVRQVACASESVLSSREALLELGFDWTLGELNVLVGTAAHARILRQAYGGDRIADEIPHLYAALERAIAVRLGEPDGAGSEASWCVPDLLAFVRFAVLRALVERLLGAAVLAAAGEAFCEAFLRFQDAVEDATAKAAVLPRAAALPLVLWPTSRKRAVVRASLASAIATALRHDASGIVYSGRPGIGPWVRALVLDDGRSPSDAAEIICGLLFAAHKNPAIGAAQALLHSLDGPPRAMACCAAEAAALHAHPTAETLSRCGGLHAAVLETLRLCAHAIGAVRKVVAPAGFDLRVGGAAQQGGARTYHLPRGSTVALAHIPTHRDPAVWGARYDEYDPGRAEWAPAAERPDDLTFTTFSQGLHRCPGERLSLPLMQCVLGLLHGGAYKTTPDGPPPPIDFERATLAQRAGPVPVRVRRSF